MRKHANAAAYWSEVGPSLEAFIERHRDKEVEACIVQGLAVYSYATEYLSKEAAEHKGVLNHTGILLVLVHDALRALPAAQAELSPVGIATLARAVLEAYCNLRLIYRSGDPPKMASLFARYMEVEKVLHDQNRLSGSASLLAPGELARIQKSSPEWFEASGKVKVRHWTADKKLSNLADLSKAVDLETEYHRFYSVGSKFVHGSPILVNLYARDGHLGAIGRTEVCSQLSMLGIHFVMGVLAETTAFYGAHFADEDIATWRGQWLALFKKMQAAAGEEPKK